MTSKVAWITGGSRGIGHAVASRLMGCGYRVAIGYHRHKKPAQQLASLHDGSMASSWHHWQGVHTSHF